MKKLLTVVGIFTGLFGFSPAFADTAGFQRSISVTGESKEDIEPDQAMMSLSLTSKDKVMANAKEHNDALVEKLLNVTRGFKIPKEKISTSNINISPEYTYNNGDNQQHFVDYAVSRHLRITVDNIAIEEKLLSAILDANIEQVDSVDFQLADPDKHADALRVKAFENAKMKAQALATAAGSKLGQVLTIETEGAMSMSERPMPVFKVKKAAMAVNAESVAPSLPGMVSLHETVSATFALE